MKNTQPTDLVPLLSEESQNFLNDFMQSYDLTHQEKHNLILQSRDLEMWSMPTHRETWLQTEATLHDQQPKKQKKKKILSSFYNRVLQLKQNKEYDRAARQNPQKKLNLQLEKSDNPVLGRCPVWSDDTVCCQLKVLDVVQNCAFACSYCTIQTFYGDTVTFDEHLGDKLKNLELDPQAFHHIGTGQSSDALVWGNRYGLLDDLMSFAKDRKNVLLEMKTKSDKVQYFLENDVAENIVCSWSLNPQTIIENEEHRTASLIKRLSAARSVADRGIKVAFHFHPMVMYAGWQKDYANIVKKLLNEFDPSEVLFISFGTLTFIKPVIQEIRKKPIYSKILQMDFHQDPKGKLTYSDEIKLELFNYIWETFKPWQDKVFFYLCMEKATIWDRLFGFHYPDNQQFADAFEIAIQSKMPFYL